jgi:PTH1 family peptidyl-tRNA hydrolase
VYALVGLGNPGLEYYKTRHSLGFWVADYVYKHADEILVKWRVAYKGEYAKVKVEGEEILLFKPMTFMNLSGEAVRLFLPAFSLSPSDMFVAHDDLDLPVGRTKLRWDGGSGGHKGVKSIIDSIQTADFWRIKIGIGRPPDGDVIAYVLGVPDENELALYRQALERVMGMLRIFIRAGYQKAMTFFNS